jgi:hypothetical protein
MMSKYRASKFGRKPSAEPASMNLFLANRSVGLRIDVSEASPPASYR